MSYLPGTKDKPKQTVPETMAIPNSSFLQAATYDSANFSLTLEFKNGMQSVSCYVYPMVWQQFKETRSHGSFYSRQIKDKYPTVNLRMSLKVSDLSRAMKEHRHYADQYKATTR